MAKRSNTELSKVVRSGITLAFVSFPAAIAEMPGAVAWSCIFFFMVLLLGLDTQFTVVEICTTAIMDYFPGVSSLMSRLRCEISAFLENQARKRSATAHSKFMFYIFHTWFAIDDGLRNILDCSNGRFRWQLGTYHNCSY